MGEQLKMHLSGARVFPRAITVLMAGMLAAASLTVVKVATMPGEGNPPPDRSSACPATGWASAPGPLSTVSPSASPH